MKTRIVSTIRWLVAVGVILSADALSSGEPAGCAGSLDLSFNAGEGVLPDRAAPTPIDHITMCPDGGVIIAGGFEAVQGQAFQPAGEDRLCIARLDPEGLLDRSYTPSPADAVSRTRALQTDGKIVEVIPWTGETRGRVTRHVILGTPDPTFKPGLPEELEPTCLALLPGGQLLVGGVYFTWRIDPEAPVPPPPVFRLNADGSIDGTFSPAVPFEFEVSVLVVQPDSKILVGGRLNKPDPVTGRPHVQPVLRLNSDGSLDPTFAPGLWVGQEEMRAWGGLPLGVNDLVLDPDGRIYMGGFFFVVNGLRRTLVARLEPDGTLDTSFAADFSVCEGCDCDATEVVSGMALTQDGKLMVAGHFGEINKREARSVARLLTTGDDCAGVISFETDKMRVNEPAGQVTINVLRHGGNEQAVSVGVETYVPEWPERSWALPGVDYLAQPGVLEFAPGETVKTITIPIINDSICEPNKPMFCRLTDPEGGAVLRTPSETTVVIVDDETSNRPGNLDESFSPVLGVRSSYTAISRIAACPDGSVLITGSFRTVDGAWRDGFARLLADGRLDASFNPVIDGEVSAAVVLPNGQILIGGGFANVNGIERHGLARLNADGTSDAAFNCTSGCLAYNICVQENGQILVVHDLGVSRLEADGSIDPIFDTGSGRLTDGSIFSVAPQTDGKVVIGGQFWHVQGESREDMARLNADGSLDGSFNPAFHESTICVYSLVVQPDGKILVGGCFTIIEGEERAGLVRLNPDGSVDRSFAPGQCGTVHDLALELNGKVLVAASVYLEDRLHRGVMRLNADGSYDQAFYTEWVAPECYVWRLARQANGDVIIGGEFQEINSLPRLWLARLYGDTAIDPDSPGSITMSTPVYRVDENCGAATIVVKRIWGSKGAVSATLTTRDDSALTGEDYIEVLQAVQFADGDAADKVVTIPILDDQEAEWQEKAWLTLIDPTPGASVGTVSVAELVIVDNDTLIEFASPTYRVHEDDQTVRVEFWVYGKWPGAVSVDYATRDGTALAGMDYEPRSGTHKFPSAFSGVALLIRLLDDKWVEGPKTFTIELSNPTGGAVFGANRTATITILDDDFSTPIGPFVERHILDDGKIELVAVPPPGTQQYSVQDKPPPWAVGNISHGGTYNEPAGRVYFGPFTDDQPRTLVYFVSPPDGTSGSFKFTGRSSINTMGFLVVGDDVIVLPEFPPPPLWIGLRRRPLSETTVVQVFGSPGVTYRIEASSDLQNWSKIGQVKDAIEWSDLDAALHAIRFYRASKLEQ